MKLKNLTFGQRIGAGFGVMLILVAAIGIISFGGVDGIVSNAELVIDGNELERTLAEKEVDHLVWANEVNVLLTDDSVTTLEVETDDHLCGFGKWLYGEKRTAAEELVPSLAPLLKEIEEPHRQLHESAISISGVFKQADQSLPTFIAEKETDHLKWASEIRDALLQNKIELDVQMDSDKCALGKWLHSEQAIDAYEKSSAAFKRSWDEMVTAHDELHDSAAGIQVALMLSNEAAVEIFQETTNPILERVLSLLEALRGEANGDLEGMEEANQIYASATLPALQSTRKLFNEIVEEARKHIMTDKVMLSEAHGTERNVTIVGLAAGLIGIMLAFFIARGLTTTLKSASSQLDDAADQVASASAQVSAGSQLLAEGTSEQAASIEETSSSLEEMSAMVRKNAENATQANMIMKESDGIISQAGNSMQGLADSMEEISRASEETSKIIKTIDEIAFQTNLLALNAAVEAARAGEAGAGFAVVADEVRNLAMRAAEAAKNTAGLIEGTVLKVKEGVVLGASTKNDFSKVMNSIDRVTELVSEIAAASGEQSRGIEQISRAVSEMENVVQKNAANAEESASASEEMNAQADQMKYVVNDLMALVGAGDRGTTQLESLSAHSKAVDEASDRKNLFKNSSRAKEITPEQVIPLNEGDFEDF